MKVLDFSSFLQNKSLNEEVYTDFDRKWDYKKEGPKWFAMKKGGDKWVDISNRPEAVNKLNAKYFPKEEPEKQKITKKQGSSKKKEDTSKKPKFKIDTSFTTTKTDSFDPYVKKADISKQQAEKILSELKKVASGGLKKEIVKTASGLVTKIPAHIRAYLNFLDLRKEPFTSEDLTKSEILSIKNMIDLRKKQKKFISGQNFDFYNASNDLIKSKGGEEQIKFGDKNLGFNQTKVKEDSTKIALTLGNAKITEKPDSYVIEDIYDFNNFQKNPEKYTLKNLPSTISESVSKLLSSNYLQGLEELSSILQKAGYKGYSVKIVVPKDPSVLAS